MIFSISDSPQNEKGKGIHVFLCLIPKRMNKAMIIMTFSIFEPDKNEKGNDIHDVFDFGYQKE